MKKLYLSIIFTVVSSLILLGWALDRVFEANTTTTESQELIQYQNIANGFISQLSKTSAEELEQTLVFLMESYKVEASLQLAADLALPLDLHPALNDEAGLMLDSENSTYLVRMIPGHSDYLLQIDIPIPEVTHSDLDLALTLALYAGLIVILILWLLPLTRRLSKLTTASSLFGDGDLSARIPASKLSYIPTLEASFNRMASQIEELMAENKLLADSLSHDLRTPLACLRFGIDAALDEEDVEKKNLYIHRLEEELTRMETMLSAFLEYASIERQGSKIVKAKANVSELLKNVIDDCQPIAHQSKVSLTIEDKSKGLLANIDAHWLYRAFLNLVTNAINYGSSQVLISVQTQNRYFVVTVSDDGDGIPENKREDIFKPFTKLDKSRARGQGNFGLGLAIVSRIVDWHHGKIEVSNGAPLSGASFTLRIPV